MIAAGLVTLILRERKSDITQRWRGSGEERIPLRSNSTETGAFVTGDAIERDECLVDLLRVIEL